MDWRAGRAGCVGHLPGVALRPGTGADHHEAAVAADLPAGENGPVTVLGDAAYGTGQARRALTDAGHTTALGRLQPNGARIAQFKKPCTPCPLRSRCTTSAPSRTTPGSTPAPPPSTCAP
ncbi:hypothetical protein SAMN05216275_101309 [Streptosporangium canum]|uniref:Transposase DDE domain-containing protein n=1 Tax=Streptosporangium canum TaxID=324952 RepID=A0A1I3FRJ3_9ACTN|nr:hypothetical protein [Streptosporangium canum]SFI13541.1 hypothetical protein SAMN05216275_101309 [Streptosporangium canum]